MTGNRAIVTWAELAVPTAPGVGGFGSHTYHEVRVALREMNGDETVEDLSIVAGSLHLLEKLYEPPTISFFCPPEVALGDLSPGTREVHIYIDGELKQAGDLLSATYTKGQAWEVIARGFAQRFYRRIITKDWDFDNEDLINMGWRIIARDSAGGEGLMAVNITRDPTSTPLGVREDLDIDGFDHMTVFDALMAFTDRSEGYEWEVTPTKTWKAYHHRKGVTLDPDLYVFDDRNIVSSPQEFSCEFDSSETLTRLMVEGSGDGRDRKVGVYQDAAAMAQYGGLEGIYQRQEHDVPRLNKLAYWRYRQMYRDIRVQPSLSANTEDPQWDAYEIGDSILVDWHRDGLDLSDVFRIGSKETIFDPTGAAVNIVQFLPRRMDIPETVPAFDLVDDEPAESS